MQPAILAADYATQLSKKIVLFQYCVQNPAKISLAKIAREWYQLSTLSKLKFAHEFSESKFSEALGKIRARQVKFGE